MRIMIVDDSRSMRLILKRMLTQMGYTEIAEAEHGGDALGRMQDFAPELTLVDWNMPSMNGLEFIQAVREQKQYDKVKLMVVTSESSPRIVYEALKAGADEYAMKPITSEIMEDKMQLLGLA